MTEYKKQLMLFKDISGKKVKVDFDGGDVTSDAGIHFPEGNRIGYGHHR